MASTIYIAYITEGREKCQYRTTIVGAFSNYTLAEQALKEALLSQEKIEYITDSPIDALVEEANDSFYRDGWDYAIEKHRIA